MQQSLFSKPIQNLLPFDGEAFLFPEFISSKDSDLFFEKLQNNIQWKQVPIKIFGKDIMQPRLTALYGNPSIPYGYSGIKMTPFPFTVELSIIRDLIQDIAETEFTHVLLNYYRDGQDSMGWHRDNEPELGQNPTIASVSFGQSREFQMRYYSDKKQKVSCELTSGSLLLMQGSTQHFWEHQIPKRKRIHGGRINLTFRKVSA